MIYPQWDINPSRWLSYVPGMILVGCFALFWWKRNAWGRPLLFGFGYFVVTLFPVLGFFDQSFYRYSLVADHWQYYSIVGVIALTVAAGVTVCRQMGKWGRDVRVLASVAVLVTLGAATWTRANVYKDEETLWRDNVAKNPNAWAAHYNLGVVLKDQVPEVIAHYEQALQLKPDFADAHNNLGIALLQAGKVNDAIGHYQQALRIQPDLAEAHNNLGTALRQVGKLEEAIRHYEQAVRIKPDYVDALNDLGGALLQVGRVQEAISHLQEALRIQPDSPGSHFDLANALLLAGNVQDAISHYKQALLLKPDYVQAHNNLGDALLQVGRAQEAISHFQEALRIQPDLAAAKHNLANAQATQEREVPSRR
jgi:tetratricopeptide (TPR) repeat protein